MRFLFLAATISLMVAPVQAEEVTGPKEVGSTTMPAGQYSIIEKVSKKTYSLTVTDKGNMILGPATDDLATSATDTKTAAGTTSAANSATTGTAKATASEAAADKASSFIPAIKNETLNGLMKQGVQRGVQEGTNQLQNLITK